MNYYLASAYGAGNYNTSDYNGSTSTSTGHSGTLTDTGIAIAGIVTLACIILLIAIVIRIWKRPGKHAATTQTSTPSSTDSATKL